MVSSRHPWCATAGIGALLVLATLLRWYHLDYCSLFADEIWSAMAARDGSLWSMLQYVYAHEGHPPGYHLVLRLTQALSGISDTALRLPSLLAGVALVYTVYRYACTWLDYRTGLLAALLVCNSYYAIYYSQEARAYALLMLAVMVHVHALTALLLTAQGRRPVLLLAASGAVAAWLHYAGAAYVACGGLLVLLAWLKDRDSGLLRAALSGYGLLLVLYAPWLPGLLHHLLYGPMEPWRQVPGVQKLWETWRLVAGHDAARAVLWAIVAAAGVVTLWRRQPWLAAILLVLSLLPSLLFFTQSQLLTPAYNTRSFSPSIPLVALAAAHALVWLVTLLRGRAAQAVAFALCLLLVSFIQWSGNLQHQLYTGHRFKQQYRQAVALAFADPAVAQAAQPGLVVAHDFFNHYVEQYPPFRRNGLVFADPAGLPLLQQQLAARGVQRFYFLDAYAGGVPSTPLSDALDAHYPRTCRTDFFMTRVIGYASSGITPDPLPPC